MTKNMIRDPDQRSSAILSIVSAQAEAGLLRQAAIAALSSEDGYWRTNALNSVAVGYAQGGFYSEALLILRKIEMTNVDTSRQNADVVRVAIVKSLALKGRMAEAEETLLGIKTDYLHVEALKSVAVALAEAGSVSEALIAARRIEDERGRIQALIRILALRNDPVLLGEVIESTIHSQNISDRSQQAADIALILSRLGRKKDAFELLAFIDDSESRYFTMSKIAVFDRDWELFQDVLEFSRELRDELRRSEFLSKFAVNLAHAGLGAEALAAVRDIQVDPWRIRALLAIAAALPE